MLALALVSIRASALRTDFVHGTLNAAHSREVAHRYKSETLVVPETETQLIVDPDAFNRYIRARVHIESPASFGVVSHKHNEYMTLFVLHRDERTHVVKAILWGTDDGVSREHQLQTLVVWHRARFFESLLADLSGDDLVLWRSTG